MLSIVSHKRAADILSNETDIENDVTPGSSDKEGDEYLPPSKVRRIGRSGSPVADSQYTGMVQSILDTNLDSMDDLDEMNKEDKEDQEYQEDREEEEDIEGEREKDIEGVEGEDNKFASEEVSAHCNLI